MEITLNQRMNNKLTIVNVGGAKLYFSYQTIIGASYPGIGTIVRKNDWGTTTARHMNEIDGGTKEAKAARLDETEFDEQLDTIMGSLALDLSLRGQS